LGRQQTPNYEEDDMAMEDREFENLIGSDNVEGAAVYDADAKKIGSVKRVMIDKKAERYLMRF
jgi:sporulation protein YlmC with PRC-barrel domain